jgi:hypothetical protein
VAAKTAYTDDGDYSGATVTGLGAIEPSLSYITGDSADPNTVSVDTSTTNDTDDTWSGAAMADSGTCFYITDVATNPSAGTQYGDDGGSGACAGTDAVGATDDAW